MNSHCLIGNLNLKVITITKLIDIFDNNNQIFHYLYLHKGLVPCQSDNINRMITLTVITISGGHCNRLSNIGTIKAKDSKVSSICMSGIQMVVQNHSMIGQLTTI